MQTEFNVSKWSLHHKSIVIVLLVLQILPVKVILLLGANLVDSLLYFPILVNNFYSVYGNKST